MEHRVSVTVEVDDGISGVQRKFSCTHFMDSAWQMEDCFATAVARAANTCFAEAPRGFSIASMFSEDPDFFQGLAIALYKYWGGEQCASDAVSVTIDIGVLMPDDGEDSKRLAADHLRRMGIKVTGVPEDEVSVEE